MEEIFKTELSPSPTKSQKKPRNFLHYVPLYSTNYKENFSEKKCSKLGENKEGFNPLFSLIEIVAGSQQL